MYWLAEQGLTPKRVFLVLIPLLIFIVVELVKKVFNNKEDKRMKNKSNTIDALNVALNVISNLSGNLTGGVLLANAL